MNVKKNISKLGEILLERHLISADQLEHALQEQRTTKQRLGTILIRNNWVSEDDLNFVLSQQLDMPYVHLNTGMIDVALVKSIPREVLESYNVLPLIRIDDELTVVMSDPTDSEAVTDLESITKCKIRRALARLSNIQQILEYVFGAVSVKPSETSVSGIHFTHPGSLDFFRKYVEGAMGSNADEIHFEPAHQDVHVRYRVAGQLIQKEPLSKAIYQALLSRVKIIFQFDFAKQQNFNSGTVSFHTGQNEIQLEGTILTTSRGEALTLRIYQPVSSTDSLDEKELGPLFQRVRSQLSRTGGVILISSKSDWLRTQLAYTLLKDMINDERKVITIEKTLTIINEKYIQLSKEKMRGLAPETVFHQALALGGDVIMVDLSGMEDLLESVFESSVHEKLIIGMLPYHSVSEVLSCLQSSHVKPFFLKTYLLSMIAGVQFHALCPSCRVPYSMEQPAKKSSKKAEKKSYYRSSGCTKCHQKGYIGFHPILEILIPTNPIKKMLGMEQDMEKVLKVSEKEGFNSLVRQSIEKAKQGIIGIEEVYQKFGELEN